MAYYQQRRFAGAIDLMERIENNHPGAKNKTRNRTPAYAMYMSTLNCKVMVEKKKILDFHILIPESQE